MKSNVKKAIDFLKDCRKTHVDWAEYFEQYPQAEEAFKETVHGANGQRKIIADYDEVIKILEEI